MSDRSKWSRNGSLLVVSLAAWGCSRPESTVATASGPATSATTPVAAPTKSAAPATPASVPPVTVDAGPCPAPTVSVDGQPMKVASARAYGFAGLPGTYVLVMSTRDVPCKELLSGGRSVKNDEWYLNVGAGREPDVQQFVNADNEHAGVRTEIVTKPEKAGDPVAICVREPARLAVKMRKTATLDASGLMRGTYCGDVK
jgi:hypothetical protein